MSQKKTTYSYCISGNDIGQQEMVTDFNAHTAGGSVWNSGTYTTYTHNPITSETSPAGMMHHVYDPVTGEYIETWTGAMQSSANGDILYSYNSLDRLIRRGRESIPMTVDSAKATTDPSPCLEHLRRIVRFPRIYAESDCTGVNAGVDAPVCRSATARII
jgi:hypothetical protein